MIIKSFDVLKCSIKSAEDKFGKSALEYRVDAFEDICSCIDLAVNDESCDKFSVDVLEDGSAVISIFTQSFLKENVDAAEEILLNSKDLHFSKSDNEDCVVVTITLDSVWDN